VIGQFCALKLLSLFPKVVLLVSVFVLDVFNLFFQTFQGFPEFLRSLFVFVEFFVESFFALSTEKVGVFFGFGLDFVELVFKCFDLRIAGLFRLFSLLTNIRKLFIPMCFFLLRFE
jgi:hypothetical protein